MWNRQLWDRPATLTIQLLGGKRRSRSDPRRLHPRDVQLQSRREQPKPDRGISKRYSAQPRRTSLCTNPCESHLTVSNARTLLQAIPLASAPERHNDWPALSNLIHVLVLRLVLNA